MSRHIVKIGILASLIKADMRIMVNGSPRTVDSVSTRPSDYLGIELKKMNTSDTELLIVHPKDVYNRLITRVPAGQTTYKKPKLHAGAFYKGPNPPYST